MTTASRSFLVLTFTASFALAGGGDEKKANPYQSPTSTWKPGQGLVLADSDEFGLKILGQIQTQYAFTANDNAPDTSNFTVRRARIGFAGHVFSKDIAYLLRLDAVDDGTGANGPVKDAWTQWTFARSEDSKVGVRAGQSKTYHGLEATGSSTGLFFVERAATTRAFSDTRSRGAWLHGAHAENSLRWVAGAQNGDVANGAPGITERGEEANNPDNELTYVASASFDPLGDITGGKALEAWRQGGLDVTETRGTVGAGVMLGNHRSAAVPNADIESSSINVNTAWAFGGGLAAVAEVYVRSDDPQTGATEDTSGWYAQGTWTTEKSAGSETQWGFGVRVNSIETDDTVTFLTGAAGLGATAGEVMEYTAVVDAFYHAHTCKTQFEYTLQEVDPDAGASSTNHIVRVQFQLLF